MDRSARSRCAETRKQVIRFVHSAWAISLHACSIVGMTGESLPPSVDFDEVLPHPTIADQRDGQEASRSD
jgi:hypothetical protein